MHTYTSYTVHINMLKSADNISIHTHTQLDVTLPDPNWPQCSHEASIVLPCMCLCSPYVKRSFCQFHLWSLSQIISLLWLTFEMLNCSGEYSRSTKVIDSIEPVPEVSCSTGLARWSRWECPAVANSLSQQLRPKTKGLVFKTSLCDRNDHTHTGICYHTDCELAF